MLGLPDNAQPAAISPDGYCQVEIIDRGAGMSPDVLGRLFEPFFTTRAGHTGMGSSLAYAVIRSHGGQTTADSEVGGTALRVYLPRTKARRAPRTPRSELTHTETRRVLLVDDNRALRAVTAVMLAAAGYDVTECASAAAAAETIATQPPFDALVVDMRLGDGTGLDVFELAGGLESGPPTLFISGYSGDDLAGLPQSKAWQFMAKPFSRQELLNQLKTLVGSRTARRAARHT
jgi:CheY-like chemotaxis protein